MLLVLTCPRLDPLAFDSYTSFACTSAADYNSKCVFNCNKPRKIGLDTNIHTCTDLDGDDDPEWDPEPKDCVSEY